jgi:hypothetical protein
MRSINTLFALIFAASSCSCEEEQLEKVCPLPEPCYIAYNAPNTEKSIKTGDSLKVYENQVCSFGTTYCDEDFNLHCEGVDYIADEICDGVDNDCDGQIDEDLISKSWHSNNPCYRTQQGVCRIAEAVCVMGEWVCQKPPLYGEEVCDGKDNDCNGEVDDNIPEEFVYDGPDGTLNVGECRAGVRYCEDGEIVTFGTRTPVPEICGNDDDDDCDGLTDELPERVTHYDFALIIDISGSMFLYIQSVRNAVCHWSANQDFANSRFAIVVVASNNHNNTIGILTDFTGAQETCDVLNNFLSSYPPSVGYEYQLDAILLSGETGDSLELSWSDRIKKIIVFTDEELQYGGTFGLFDEIAAVEKVKESCVDNNYSVNAFIGWFSTDYHLWSDMTSSCSGYLDFLSPAPEVMVEKLNYWFGREC